MPMGEVSDNKLFKKYQKEVNSGLVPGDKITKDHSDGMPKKEFCSPVLNRRLLKSFSLYKTAVKSDRYTGVS